MIPTEAVRGCPILRAEPLYICQKTECIDVVGRYVGHTARNPHLISFSIIPTQYQYTIDIFHVLFHYP